MRAGGALASCAGGGRVFGTLADIGAREVRMANYDWSINQTDHDV